MGASSNRLRVAVLFGGRSAEHEVSVLSAINVVRALDRDRYDPVPVFVTREGKWLASRFDDAGLAQPTSGLELCLVPGGRGRLLGLEESGEARELPKVDVLFPVLHGLHGEDGSVQGMAEVALVPLVGCGILGSAVALDKDIAKRLLKEAGIGVARGVTIGHDADQQPEFADLIETLGQPIFIKPARQGSSVGVSKVADTASYQAALAEGFRHDRKLLAEEFVQGREIECSVLEDEQGGLFVSRPGEIVPAESHGFYSYDAKYVDADGAALKVPADLPEELEAKIRETAARAFRALGCDGMARVDFFVTGNRDFVVNELNTIPGFTNISMYPKAMEASGISQNELVDRLIRHALARGG